jgi:hypothetical protein
MQQTCDEHEMNKDHYLLLDVRHKGAQPRGPRVHGTMTFSHPHAGGQIGTNDFWNNTTFEAKKLQNANGIPNHIGRGRSRCTLVNVTFLVGACVVLLLMEQSFSHCERCKTWLFRVEPFLKSPFHEKTVRTSSIPQAFRRRLIDLRQKSIETLDFQGNETKLASHKDSRQRLLYIVTSSSADRVDEVVFPIILDAVDSFVQSDKYSVIDVYMIVSYTFLEQNINTITALLPPGIGLQVWDDAMPFYCNSKEDPQCRLIEGDAQLARQHRFVIKDKMPYYDFFVVFEDVRGLSVPSWQNQCAGSLSFTSLCLLSRFVSFFQN